MKRLSALFVMLAVGVALAACQRSPAAEPAPAPTGRLTAVPPTAAPTLQDEEKTATPQPEVTPSGPIGPDDYPPGINPLTGLPVTDPAVLERRPIIVKVSNESDEVRPQSGLSFADHVWMYQTEGWRQTRFAAIIFGATPERVGSVRSARLFDAEHLIPMYDGLLVISGAGKDMYRVLMNSSWWERVFRDEPPYQVRLPDLPRPGTDYYHTLFAIPAEVWREAEVRGLDQPPDLAGLSFSYAPPPGGTPTTEVSIDYPEYGPLQTWRFDAASGRWLSWTDIQLELEHEPAPDIDLLTGAQLAFDNVVIVWVEHYIADDFVEVPGIGANLIGTGQAVLLRDGQRYEVTWQRSDPEKLVRFVDAAGQAVPFKPGQTWFHLASTESTGYPPAVEYTP